MSGPDDNNTRKRDKRGILRLDINKPRSSSGGSVEFRDPPELFGQVNSENECVFFFLSLFFLLFNVFEKRFSFIFYSDKWMNVKYK